MLLMKHAMIGNFSVALKDGNTMKHAMIGNFSVALKENNDGTYEVLVDCGGEEVSISVMAVPGSEEV